VHYRGNPVSHALLEETGSDKGVNLLDNPTHTPLDQSKPTSPFSCHRVRAMGRGRSRDETRGGGKVHMTI